MQFPGIAIARRRHGLFILVSIIKKTWALVVARGRLGRNSVLKGPTIATSE